MTGDGDRTRYSVHMYPKIPSSGKIPMVNNIFWPVLRDWNSVVPDRLALKVFSPGLSVVSGDVYLVSG